MRGHPGQAQAEWERCGRGPGHGSQRAWQACVDHRGQRQRVRWEGDGCLSGLKGGATGLHPAREAYRECFHRELQWEAQGRVLEHRYFPIDA